MHRFRKKSDAKRGEAGVQNSPGRPQEVSSYPAPTSSTYSTISQASSSYLQPLLQPLPTLPPVSDFRTSLILPDLSKRFTLLRTSTGDPVSLDDLKSRFAQQRANGTEQAISEEEEDMLLEVLSRMRSSNAAASSRGTMSGSDSSHAKSDLPSSPFSGSDFGHSSERESSLSGITSSAGLHDSVVGGSSLSLSPSDRSTKRHSNNMFGGGFKERSYIRKQTARIGGSNRSVLSTTPSEASDTALIDSYTYADDPRPATPENAPSSLSGSQSSPSDKLSSTTRSPILSLASVEEDSSGASTLRLSKTLTNSQLKRMSTSLEKVIREIEEEAEDQVLVPRTPISNGMFTPAKPAAVTMDTENSNELLAHAITTVNETAVTFSEADVDRPSSAGGFRSPSPFYAASNKSPTSRVMANSPIIPRSTTPRNIDLEDQRSHSTTPRAASPSDRLIHTMPLSMSASSLLRHGSNASAIHEERRAVSPFSSFTFPKPSTGRSTPEPPSDGSPHTHSPTPWRRPASPLNNSSYPILNGSRPGTPSNVTWTVGTKSPSIRPLGRSNTVTSSHSRNASTTSIGNSQEVAELKGAARESLRAATRSPPAHNMVDRLFESTESRSKFDSISSQSPLPSLGFDASALAQRAAMSPSPTREISNATGSSNSANGSFGDNIQRMRSPFLTPPASPFSPKFKVNPLMVDPLVNSSRSSLVSAGSSYHSWEEENDVGIAFRDTSDTQAHVWHDIPVPPTFNGTSSSIIHSRSGSRSKLNHDSPEYILRHATGLSKLDILSIQSKLLEAAAMRARMSETRSPSTLRRRRPSTAQSVQSFGGPSRTTSPAPQPYMSASSPVRSTENVAKASALLSSLADSIEKPVIPPKFMNMNDAEKEVVASDLGPSSPSRRNKDLADILFGADIASSPSEASEQSHPPPPQQQQQQEVATPEHPDEKAEESEASLSQADIAREAVDTANEREPAVKAEFSPQAENPDPGDLIFEVQKRAEAAMAQLQRSMQTTRSPVQNGTPRKRINRGQISNPTLVQSSTSIDKIPTFPASPINSPQRSTSKLSNSIRRLRNTLRSKPSAPNGEEVTPWSTDAMVKAPNSGSHQQLTNSSKHSALSPSNNGSFNGFRSTASISPPASAGPSLKTFMNRFRRKGSNENQMDVEHRNGSSPFNSSLTSSASISPDERHGIPVPFSAPPTQVETFPRTKPYPLQSPILSRQTTDTATIHASQVSPPASPPPPGSPSDPAALRRFFDAAQDIGLGKVALDYLASVNPEWTPSTPTVIVTGNDSAKNSLEETHSFEESHSPVDRVASPVSQISDFDLGRARSLRDQQVSPPVPRRVRELSDANGGSNNPIVRRTLIFPSANGSSTDLATLIRKASKKAHRVSAVSTQSNRSVHDRVPTPPPSKAKRQSVDTEPPVPILPPVLPWTASHAAGARSLSDVNAEKSNSNSLHDSFYDMYTGDRSGSSQAQQEQFEPPKTPVDELMGDMEAGQAIEITEMANGETIWSIVNGLRSDDAESVYQHRVSMASAYSEAPHEGEGEQLFFKEHARNLSKGSSRSNLGLQRKGTLTGGASRNRPETKVFYSSTAHIARLIEQLSRGADAGSFNIKPAKQTGGHSHSGSLQSEADAHWTVEERLDHMLGVVGTAT